MIVELAAAATAGAVAVEVKKRKVELERKILREYALHLEALFSGGNGFASFFATLRHSPSSCDACTRAAVVLRPYEPWRGWAL